MEVWADSSWWDDHCVDGSTGSWSWMYWAATRETWGDAGTSTGSEPGCGPGIPALCLPGESGPSELRFPGVKTDMPSDLRCVRIWKSSSGLRASQCGFVHIRTGSERTHPLLPEAPMPRGLGHLRGQGAVLASVRRLWGLCVSFFLSPAQPWWLPGDWGLGLLPPATWPCAWG